MRNILFIIWALLIATAGAMVWLRIDNLRFWIIGLLMIALLMLILFYRMSVLPGRIVKRGFELLESQDFNNRLVKVGENTADRMVALFNTMIDRLRSERLRNMERESFLHLLIDASPMGVMILDLDGRVSMINRAFLHLCGISGEGDISGHTIEQLPEPMQEWLMRLPYGESVVFRPGDSRLFRGSHLSFVQSGFNRRFYLLENLTEEVMEAERNAYEKVIRVISHEVNNTMGGVRTLFGMLADEPLDPELRNVIESCDRRCGEMTSFINDYADVVRLPAPDLRPVRLDEILRQALPFLQTLLSPGISLRLEVEQQLVIDADRPQIEQVLVNIIKNAIESFADYPVENPLIEIKVFSSGRRIILQIIDNGRPIPSETESHLFSPFFTTKPTGKGLGLTLTGEILSQHSARWSLHTDPATLLTTFTIEFPLPDTPGSPIPLIFQ